MWMCYLLFELPCTDEWNHFDSHGAGFSTKSLLWNKMTCLIPWCNMHPLFIIISPSKDIFIVTKFIFSTTRCGRRPSSTGCSN
jgi:hypothetical protein